MSWAVWLAVPVGATVLAALWVWFRGWRVRRAARRLTTEQAMRAHERYLQHLVIPARSLDRPERHCAADPAGPSTLPR